VRHPEHPDFLEEDWLYEALTECYVPLVRVLDGLESDGVPCRIALSVSPTLLEMLEDDLLIGRYERRLDGLIELSRREVERRTGEIREAALHYVRELTGVRGTFRDRYGSRLTRALIAHRDGGRLQLLGSAATHAFLPHLTSVPEAIRAQVETGVRHHAARLERSPEGFWLPECGYAPGIETALRGAGVTHSLLEGHGLLHGSPRPSCGVLAPVVSPGGVAFFARDERSSREVWSAEVGYPGAPDYREFYRDLGFELSDGDRRRYVGEGPRRGVGLKYHRVTGRVELEAKQPYRRERAVDRAREHAQDFLSRRQAQVREAAPAMDRPPVVVSPYDAELFGHWWYEGPVFLDALLRALAGQDEVEVVTPGEYLERHPECELVQPESSSWGRDGYAQVWLSPSNDWIQPPLLAAAERLVALASRNQGVDGLAGRTLRQAARELMLAQSSDWPFMIETDRAADYARRRVQQHLESFGKLAATVESGRLDEALVRDCEWRYRPFPQLDFSVYAQGDPA
jgi:1,4-alpha-glucan branching enzyme